MLLIDCPYCGARPELEFDYGGEAHIARPANPAHEDDEAWSAFLYFRTNPQGLHVERWRHSHGCARFFNAVRNTVNDQILICYRVGETKPDLASLARDATVLGGR